jgi:beta-catenin-like protein 1
VRSKGKAPAVEDGDEESEFAGPELPPDLDEEDVPDDEEGRFFGGGMARETARAMEYLDQQDQERGDVAVGGISLAA